VELTNTEGIVIKVELLNYKDNVVDFRNLSNNKVYKLPMDKLNGKSQVTVKKWVKNGGNYVRKYEIKFEDNRTKKTDRNSSYYDDYEDKVERINAEVIIANDSIRGKSTAPVKLVVVTLSKPVQDPDNVKVIGRKTFKVPSIEAKKSKVFKMEPVQLKYDNTGYVHGYKFQGYALYLVEGGEIVYSEYSSKTIEKKFGKRLFKAEKEQLLIPN